MLFLSDVMNNSGTQFIAFVFLVKPYLDIRYRVAFVRLVLSGEE